jgi:hypothetical protein
MSKELKALAWKLIGGFLTLLVTGLCYFVWDLHAWKSSMGELDEVTFVRHIKDQELKNQYVILTLKLQGIEAKDVKLEEVSP